MDPLENEEIVTLNHTDDVYYYSDLAGHHDIRPKADFVTRNVIENGKGSSTVCTIGPSSQEV